MAFPRAYERFFRLGGMADDSYLFSDRLPQSGDCAAAMDLDVFRAFSRATAHHRQSEAPGLERDYWREDAHERQASGFEFSRSCRNPHSIAAGFFYADTGSSTGTLTGVNQLNRSGFFPAAIPKYSAANCLVMGPVRPSLIMIRSCLLYTSDAADDLLCV